MLILWAGLDTTGELGYAAPLLQAGNGLSTLSVVKLGPGRGIEACVELLSVCELSFPPCSFLNYKRKWCPVRGLLLLIPGARLYLKSACVPWPPGCRGANVSFAVHLGPHQSVWSTFLSPSGDSFALQIPFVVWLGRSRAEIARAEPCCLWVESKPMHFVS